MRKNRVVKWHVVICNVLAVLLLAGCGGNGTQPSRNTAESTETVKESSEAATEGTTVTRVTAAETQPSQTTAAETQPVRTTAAQAQPDGTPPAGNQPSAAAQAQGITEADAKRIALSHANVSETDAVYMRVKLEREHGRDEYDVEFYAGNTEYDYEIDALTGEILSYDHDAESYTPPAAQNPGGAVYITQEQAKAAAFAHANVSEADVYKLKVEFDQDHGKAEYEIEFEAGHTEYEYEIDGVTGEVISFEADHD